MVTELLTYNYRVRETHIIRCSVQAYDNVYTDGPVPITNPYPLLRASLLNYKIKLT